VLLGSLQADIATVLFHLQRGVVVCAVFDARRVARLVAFVTHWHVGVSAVVFAGSAPADLARALLVRSGVAFGNTVPPFDKMAPSCKAEGPGFRWGATVRCGTV
jgi:hypothetical protein